MGLKFLYPNPQTRKSADMWARTLYIKEFLGFESFLSFSSQFPLPAATPTPNPPPSAPSWPPSRAPVAPAAQCRTARTPTAPPAQHLSRSSSGHRSPAGHRSFAGRSSPAGRRSTNGRAAPHRSSLPVSLLGTRNHRPAARPPPS